MVRRVAVAVLAPPVWVPPSVDARAWRIALAEDLLDVLALMTEVEAAVAVTEDDADIRGAIGWPGLRSYVLPALDVATLFRAAASDFDQAALLVADAPDLPGLIIAKLLRPLTTRPFAAAPATGGTGLVGLAGALPAPDWLPPAALDDLTPQALRRLAPAVTDVAPAAGWHRLRGPESLELLDPRLEGWEATRALLSPASS